MRHGALAPLHLIIIPVIAFHILESGKLPETGEALGHAIREFRHGWMEGWLPVAARAGSAGWRLSR